MSGAELVKEIFQSGALHCAGLLPQVFKKRHPFHLHYTHVRAFYALVAPEESLMCNPCYECKKLFASHCIK
jgi:hypothetical protein